MASGVEELLDILFEMIDEAKHSAFSSDKCVIERDRALDLIDEIRNQFPIELTEAQKIMASRNEIISIAKRDAENIRKESEQKARQLLSDDAIASQGKQKANEMLQMAEVRSRELRRAANEYCEDTLRRTEEAVAAAYDEIKRSHARFRAAAGASPVPGSTSNSRPIFDAAAED